MLILPHCCEVWGTDHTPCVDLTAFCPFPPPATGRLPPATRRSKTEGKLIIFYVGFLFSWVSSLVQFTAQHPNIHADRTRQERKEQLTVARASPQQWNWLYAPPSQHVRENYLRGGFVIKMFHQELGQPLTEAAIILAEHCLFSPKNFWSHRRCR